MLEVLGMIVWISVTVCLSLIPILMLEVSALGNTCLGAAIFIVITALSIYSWYSIFNLINIKLG